MPTEPDLPNRGQRRRVLILGTVKGATIEERQAARRRARELEQHLTLAIDVASAQATDPPQESGRVKRRKTKAPDGLLTVADVAARCDKSPATVLKWIHRVDGLCLAASRPAGSRSYLIKPADLETFLDASRLQPVCTTRRRRRTIDSDVIEFI